MTNSVIHHIWQKRLDEIDNPIRDIHIPKNLVDKPDQDEEWCEVITNDSKQRIRFHDYDEVFGIPGLYEMLFYDTLECCSPGYVVNLLEDVANEWNTDLHSFKVLDVGAGAPQSLRPTRQRDGSSLAQQESGSATWLIQSDRPVHHSVALSSHTN